MNYVNSQIKAHGLSKTRAVAEIQYTAKNKKPGSLANRINYFYRKLRVSGGLLTGFAVSTTFSSNNFGRNAVIIHYPISSLRSFL